MDKFFEEYEKWCGENDEDWIRENIHNFMAPYGCNGLLTLIEFALGATEEINRLSNDAR